jgi:hypothetical protein
MLTIFQKLFDVGWRAFLLLIMVAVGARIGALQFLALEARVALVVASLLLFSLSILGSLSATAMDWVTAPAPNKEVEDAAAIVLGRRQYVRNHLRAALQMTQLAKLLQFLKH